MKPETLREALTGESERVEWKQSTSRVNEILQAVCALANDLGGSQRPGYLVLGLADDGRSVGISGDLDWEQQALVNRVTSARLFPTPAFNIEVVDLDGKSLLIVCIDPYPVPPVVTVDGTAWVRKGTVTEKAKDSDLLRLRERRPENRQPFDFRGIPTASLENLRSTELREMYLAAKGTDHNPDSFPEFETWLTRKDLGKPLAEKWIPNAAAILLFGDSPQSFFPGGFVEFVRYGGVEFDEPIVMRKTATGVLTDQLETLWVQLNANLASLPAPVDGIRTPFRPEYPIDALRELVRNLVQHRLYEGTNAPGRIEWFDDRVVFSNPGGPFGQAGIGEFGSHADYRNPTLTRWLVDLGYVEQLGRGIKLVRRMLENNGNPPLEVEVDGFTRITVRRII